MGCKHKNGCCRGPEGPLGPTGTQGNTGPTGAQGPTGMPEIPTDSVTIYANAETGNDSNDGLTPATAVETIPKAIEILSAFTAQVGTIQLLGNSSFDLGSDPILNFFPAVNRYGKINIVGERENVITDTVTVVTDLAPDARNWRQITGTQNYPANFYKDKYIQNVNINRAIVVDDNTVNTIDTIVGASNISAEAFPFELTIEPWNVGDTFVMFTLKQQITWSGNLHIEAPTNTINFKEIIIRASTSGSALVAPSDHRVVFTSCQLDMMSGDSQNPSYQGSLVIQGCYSNGLVSNSVFSGSEPNRCIMTDSFSVYGGVISYSGNCNAYWLKMEAGWRNTLFLNASDFIGQGIQILNPTAGACLYTTAASSMLFNNCEFISTISSYPYVLSIDTESSGVFQNTTVDAGASGPFTGIYVQEGCDIRLASKLIVNARRILQLTQRGRVDLLANFTFTGMTVAPIIMIGHSVLDVRSLQGPLVAPAGYPIIENSAGSLHIYGINSQFLWGTVSPQPLVKLSNGATCIMRVGNALTNSGNPGAIVQVGGNPTVTGYATDNDILTGTPSQNCFNTVY